MNTNVFGTHMVCEQLFPLLNDGARLVQLWAVLLNELNFSNEFV